MLEIPEAGIIARQIKEIAVGKRILNAVAGKSPHGFAFYSGDSTDYEILLSDKIITDAVSYGGRPELHAEDMVLSFSDGINVRCFAFRMAAMMIFIIGLLRKNHRRFQPSLMKCILVL